MLLEISNCFFVSDDNYSASFRRCGMIYMEATQLGWMTLIKSWMMYNFPPNLSLPMKTMIQVRLRFNPCLIN